MHQLTSSDPKKVGKYRLIGRLGGGGMGVVYLGEDKGRRVAVKLIRPELAQDDSFLARFKHEVHSASLVDGAFTAEVLDADVEGSRPFLVTEFISGPTLDEYIRHSGPLLEDGLVAFAVALLEALSSIHKIGLVHRDLKPTNVLLSESGPKVIDFGIARAADLTSITHTGMTLGTPAWMAPEQARGESAGWAADIFSWASLVAYAGTGNLPFGEGTSDAMLYRVVHEQPRLAGLASSVRPAVEEAIQKSPEARPSAGELIGLLLNDETLVGSPSAARTVATSFVNRTWVLPEATTHISSLPRSRPVGRVASISILVALALAGSVFAATFVSKDPAVSPLSDTVSTPSADASPKKSTTQGKRKKKTVGVVADRPAEGLEMFTAAIGATTPWYNDLVGPFGSNFDTESVEAEALQLGAWYALADWCEQEAGEPIGRCYDLSAGFLDFYLDRDPRTINSATWGQPGAIGGVIAQGYDVTARYLSISSSSMIPDLTDGRPGLSYLCEPSCSSVAEITPDLDTAALSINGIGPVRVGMTLAEASASAGTKISMTSALRNSCGPARASDGPAGLTFLVYEGRIVRIEVGEGSTIETLSGVGVGSSADQVLETYPGQIVSRPYPGDPASGANLLIYEPRDASDKAYGMLFGTYDGVVEYIYAGEAGPIQWYEGCY